MAHRKILLAITTLVLTTAAAPSAPSHAIVARDAPCDAYSETCRPVIQANACFAQFVRVGTKEDVLQCVDDQDEARAEELFCACYGCAETTVQEFATGIVGCKATASGL